MEINDTASHVQDSDVTRVMDAPNGEVERTMVAGAVIGETTQMAATVVCPVCGTGNTSLETYCSECGFLMSSQPGSAAEPMSTPSSAFELIEDRTGRKFPLREGVNTVGRENCDVLLMDPTVSRRHAQITVTGGAAQVLDSGSTNGTLVDGAPLPAGTNRSIVPGTVIRFGSASFTLAGPAAAEVSATARAAEPAAAGETPAEEAGEPPVALLRAEKPGLPDIPIASGVTTVGRRAGNTHVIAGDPYVSGRHAEIHAEPGQVTITDVGSTNGTMVNGTRITPNEPMRLLDGDEVAIGQGKYVFETVAPPEPFDEAEPEAMPADEDDLETGADGSQEEHEQ
jgi:pSer/pThr/pTyr-binding forkhead associated (FHA) protein